MHVLVPSLPMLPLVSNVQDCNDFWRTAYPYLYQVDNYWQFMVNSAYKADDALTFYKDTNPLLTAFLFSLALAPLFLVISELNKNYSQVDRCWSILPSVYIAHYVGWAHLNGMHTQRLDIILGLSLLWSTRLTYNYWRKGGYTIGSEDYRWEVIKSKIPSWLMFVFNVLFISLAQSLLLFTITTPVYVFVLASQFIGNNLTLADGVYAGVIFTCIALSYFADQSQWSQYISLRNRAKANKVPDYYAAREEYRSKARVPKSGGYSQRDLEIGFNHTGLFAYSRHPNFAAEQGVWVTLWSWCCYKTMTYANWTTAGAAGYLILFQASTWFTELVTEGKYPEYAEYRKRVSKFLPKITTLLTGPPSNEWVNEKKTAAKTNGKKR